VAARQSQRLRAVAGNIALDMYPVGKVPDPTDTPMMARADADPFGGFRGDLTATWRPQRRVELDLWVNYKYARKRRCSYEARKLCRWRSDGLGHVLFVAKARISG